MRTSPPSMRLRRRAPALVLHLALGMLVASATACGDDGDDGTSPTTTSPTTAVAGAGDDDAEDAEGGDADGPDEEPTGSDDGGSGGDDGTAPGGEVDVLTADEAEAQLTALLAAYRDAVTAAAAAGTLDEAALAALGRVFSGPRAAIELQGLQQVGVEALNPTPSTPSVGDVELAAATPGCTGGTATIDGIATFVTVPVDVVQPYYFRLVPAADGSAAPAWRLDFLGFSTNDVPLDGETTCD